MKKIFILTLFLVLAWLLSACTPAATPTAAPSAPGSRAYATAAPEPTRAPAATKAPGQTSAVPAAPRLVIKNADLTIVVADPKAALTAITRIANEMGGYVVSAKSYQTTRNGVEVAQGDISLRVEAQRLDDALEAIHSLVKDPGKDVTSENISGQDVTADYVDLKSRLGNLESTEKQLLRIQEAATKTEDVLAVFNKVHNVRQEIEQIKGQMNYFEDAAALSSINVSVEAKVEIPPVTVSGWQPAGTLRDAFQALVNLGQGLVNLLIWLVVVFLPIGLVIYFPGRWLFRLYRKSNPKPVSSPPATED
jgi:hypothetical protein